MIRKLKLENKVAYDTNEFMSLRMIKKMLNILGSFYRRRISNFGNWLIKVMVLLFVIMTMASKFYLLTNIPDLPIKDSEIVIPLHEALATVREERQAILTTRNDNGSDSDQLSSLLTAAKRQRSQRSLTSGIWKQPVSKQYYKCSPRSKKEIRTYNATDGYILITANGDLNQIRAGISDMVAIAQLMNATLVQPKLNHNSYSRDSDQFKDVFNWEHFVETLKDDVMIIESLPTQFEQTKILIKNPNSWSKANHYKWEMSRLLKKHKVIRFSGIDSRLANNGLSGSVQRLRCRAMFESLEYTDDIKTVASNFIKRLRSNNNPYVALQLRYDKDILALTGCDHNTEAQELSTMRRLTGHMKEKHVDGKERRRRGICPLTPREVAMFLEAMGFPNDTTIYIFSGEIQGRNGIENLREKYPNLFNHASLASKDELEPFLDHNLKLAAIDYMVAMESDIFVYNYDGHMAKAVKGHRLHEGFRKTVSPDIRRIVEHVDLLDNKSISWENFSSQVQHLHKDNLGAPRYRTVGPVPRLEEYFYANPYPGCICERSR